MNLAPFLNRTVVVQLKQMWLLVDINGGRPMVIYVPDPNAPPPVEAKPPALTAVPTPFVRGKLIERDGQFIIQCMSETSKNDKLELIIAEDVIHSVTSISEDRIIAP